MGDLVREHARELRRVVRRFNETRVHVNVSTGNCKRVHRLIAHDQKLPCLGRRQIRWRDLRDDARAHVAQVRERLRIVDELHLMRDVAREIRAELPLIFDGDDVELELRGARSASCAYPCSG